MSLLDQVAALTERMRTHGMRCLTIGDTSETLRLTLDNSAIVSTPHHSAVTVISPEMGIIHFVSADTHVVQGDIIAFLTIGALRLPIEAPVTGRIVDHHITDGAVIGYGDAVVDVLPA